jgi:hypothetical protein
MKKKATFSLSTKSSLLVFTFNPLCALCLCGENVFPSFPEEALKEFPALITENSWSHLHPVIQSAVFQQSIKGGNGAPLGIFHSENQAPDPRLENGPCAHDTGFQGHI